MLEIGVLGGVIIALSVAMWLPGGRSGNPTSERDHEHRTW